MTETSNGANNTNVGINVLLNRTAGIAELALNVAHLAEKHVEYLPYPDKEFDDPNVDHSYQIDNKFSIAHAYDRDVRSFMPNVRVYVKSIDAERLYSHVTQFLNPWLYTIIVAHGPFEWTIKKRYKHFSELHKILVKFVEDETKRSTASLNNYCVEIMMMDDVVFYSFSQINLHPSYLFLSPRLTQDQDTDRPCFPTRNDRFALINDHLIKSRCVSEFCIPSFKESFMKKRPHDDYRGRSLFQRIPFCFDTCKFYHGKR
ncbi:unnamed protein product [Didymodactylos carnosus]|uniref:PX domain-containing protein n=1 Tax=Didymodactylos carnosus TaxID=1234261 RepID=A0A8S2EQ70_9BILA|nr:unnamed protein product [Didymodactylos carnosus]CAF4052886.1 unnamed protein product [Didymodactylos carnosus]